MDEVLKKKLTLVEKGVKKIDFYGTKVNLVPLVTYSIFHLGLYVYNFFLGNLPWVFINLFSNTFLTILYVIVSLFLLEYVVAKLISLFTQLCVDALRCIRNSMVPQFKNAKLMARMNSDL